MSNAMRNPLVLIGALLILLGVGGLAVPVFTTSQMKDVAKIGDLKIQANQDTTRYVPQSVSVAALLLGVMLTGIGLARAPGKALGN